MKRSGRRGKASVTKRGRAGKKVVGRKGKKASIEREAMEIPFVRNLSQQNPGLGRALRDSYYLGTNTAASKE